MHPRKPETAGVQQAHKRRPESPFTSIHTLAPAKYVAATGQVRREPKKRRTRPEKKAAIFHRPRSFGTVGSSKTSYVTLAEAPTLDRRPGSFVPSTMTRISTGVRQARQSPSFLKARIERDLAHWRRTQNTGKGNLFVIFGEPTSTILPARAIDARLISNPKSRSTASTSFTHRPRMSRSRTRADGIVLVHLTPTTTKKASSSRHAYFSRRRTPTKVSKHPQAEIKRRSPGPRHSDTSRPSTTQFRPHRVKVIITRR